MEKNKLEQIQDRISGKSPEDILKILSTESTGRVAFSSSFGLEDQAISHMILSNKLPIRIFSLDTGRLFNETYFTQYETNARYNTKIESFFPDKDLVENLMNTKGPYSFFDSVENRKECCHIRKVLPLQRALHDVDFWITGIRADQGVTRKDMPQAEWDDSHKCIKVHPILHWTFDEVKSYIKQNKIPYNELHDKGFPSIGCAPCTRAVQPGEDIRAGRWWWENADQKECGLHVTDGKLERKAK